MSLLALDISTDRRADGGDGRYATLVGLVGGGTRVADGCGYKLHLPPAIARGHDERGRAILSLVAIRFVGYRFFSGKTIYIGISKT